MSSITVISTIKTTTNSNKHIITNEIVWISQFCILKFFHATFSSKTEVSVVFNISSSHANTNLLNR